MAGYKRKEKVRKQVNEEQNWELGIKREGESIQELKWLQEGAGGGGEAAGDRKEWLRRYPYYWAALGERELKKELEGRTKEGEQIQEREEWRLRAESKWWGEEEVRWKT